MSRRFLDCTTPDDLIHYYGFYLPFIIENFKIPSSSPGLSHHLQAVCPAGCWNPHWHPNRALLLPPLSYPCAKLLSLPSFHFLLSPMLSLPPAPSFASAPSYYVACLTPACPFNSHYRFRTHLLGSLGTYYLPWWHLPHSLILYLPLPLFSNLFSNSEDCVSVIHYFFHISALQTLFRWLSKWILNELTFQGLPLF